MINELIEKYERKVAYRQDRLEQAKKTLERINTKYENGECEFESLYNAQRNVAIQQDLLIELVEIVNDLKGVR